METGFLLIDKPPGPTSHDIVDRLRRITGVKKIGHAGTLDPFASGLLFMAIGREATREIAKCVGLDKTYEADIVLGVRSTTLDPEGELTSVPVPNLSIERLGEAMQSLTGELDQIPPMHSAIKIGGKRLYKLARQGKEIEREPRKIHVSKFELISPIEPNIHPIGPIPIRAHIACGSGTYVRALARDLGEALGTAGYLSALRRTEIGSYTVDNAHHLEDLTPENWKDFLIDQSSVQC